MSRETENTILLLVGLSIGLVTVTGAFTRYVKPELLPWLAITAVLLVGLALVAIVGDIRRGGPGHDHDRDHDDGHSHRSGVVWLLVVPVVVLIFVSPPALLPQAASVRSTANDVSPRGFPPLPPGTGRPQQVCMRFGYYVDPRPKEDAKPDPWLPAPKPKP